MDARMTGATVAVVAALTLLVPTFNALDNSYVENVTPPPWVPTPKEIPPDFKPPPDFEPPEDWEGEIPEDWEMPPGYEGQVPPACPPPQRRPIPEWIGTYSMQNGDAFGGYRLELPYDMPENVVGFGGRIQLDNWQAQSVAVEIRDPDGLVYWDNETQGNIGQFPPAGQPADLDIEYISINENAPWPPGGTYTLALNAEFPIEGTWSIDFEVALPCGGLLHEEA